MDLLKDNTKKLYLKFLIPSLGSAMVMSIYTLTDAIVIGKGVGADALAALNLVTPLICILMSMGIMFGIGGSVQMSVLRGTGEQEKANRYFTLSFIALAAFTLLIWLLYGFGMPHILRWMGGNEILLPYALQYMRYIDWFLPFVVFSNFFAIFVRADQDPNRAMAGVLFGGVLNIALDIIFVFPLQMGMGGAALASMLGMTLQVSVACSHFWSKKNQLRLIRPHKPWTSSAVILGNGIPSFFNELANGFIVFLFNIQFLHYCGASALSVYSVISNCVILFNSLFTGVGQAIQPIVSTNFGASNWGRIRAVQKLSYFTIVILGAAFSLIGLLFPTQVCAVFLKMTPALTVLAKQGMRLYFFAFLPMGLNLLTSYFLQAVLQVKKSLAISVLRNIVLSAVGILLFPMVWGGDSLWIVMPVVEVLVLIMSIKCFCRFKQKQSETATL